MSNSSFVTYTKISPNKTHPRNHAIDMVIVHSFVGNVTAKEGCNCNGFTKYNPVSGASCNYVVGFDGSIGLCVPEEDRSWCTGGTKSINGISGKKIDHRAITIEVASEVKSPYEITDAAMEALIQLLVDICRRNPGIKTLKWCNDKELVGQVNLQNMALHRWFKPSKSCPGDYIVSKLPFIVDRVNSILGSQEPIEKKEHVIYKVYNNQKWLGEVMDYNNVNGNGYAGNDESPVSAIAIKAEHECMTYRVHVAGGKWLPWVSGYNTKDNKNGYAGNKGQPIDAIQIKPIDGYDVRYRVSTFGSKEYLPWVTNYNLKNGDGYAGIIGRTIDKVQIELIRK